MGFFRSLKELHDIGREQRRTFSVQDQLASMQASMDQASAAMAMARPAAGSVPATASITSMRDTGTMLNNAPLVEFELMVQVTGGAPVPARTTCPVPLTHLSSLVPGGRIAVLADAANPAGAVAIDWSRAA